MDSLSMVDLQDAIDRLALAPPCRVHGRVHLVICECCLCDVYCQACEKEVRT